jgi:hypothetical protein
MLIIIKIKVIIIIIIILIIIIIIIIITTLSNSLEVESKLYAFTRIQYIITYLWGLRNL